MDGDHARLSNYLDDFIQGFADYAEFLGRQNPGDLLAGFGGLTVRRVIRPTRFYAMQLHRLRNHRAMDDGVLWSAQADFAARLADWEREADPAWPLHRAERTALVELNVPHFVMATDGQEICDAAGISIPAGAVSGLGRARARLHSLDAAEIAWQIELIRQNTGTLGEPARRRSLLASCFRQAGRPAASLASPRQPMRRP